MDNKRDRYRPTSSFVDENALCATLEPPGRHSGPSYDAIHQLRSLPEIQQRGRWSCPGSVARYKRPGSALAG